MNSTITSSRKMKLMASISALVATLVICSATLALADRYARTGADSQVTLAGAVAAPGALRRG